MAGKTREQWRALSPGEWSKYTRCMKCDRWIYRTVYSRHMRKHAEARKTELRRRLGPPTAWPKPRERA